MSRPVVLGCLLLAACEPVLLLADESGSGVGSGQAPAMRASDAGPALSQQDADAIDEPAISAAASAPRPDDAATPEVLLSVKAIDCGCCFDVVANGLGGAPPYRYEWEDGSQSQRRRVCVGTNEQMIRVIVEDAVGARSNAYVTNLQTDADDAACPANTPVSTMCLKNPSFEGPAAINTGQTFAATPWSDCTDPASGTATNTPDIANDTLDPMTGIAPSPKDGTTYLAMSTGEQASQQLCEALTAGSKTNLLLDAARMNIGSPEMYLQIWGGVSANCSQRQLLWVSPPLNTSWTSYCAPIAPGEYMDQITLRAETPTPDIVINYLAVDNLRPVDACPDP